MNYRTITSALGRVLWVEAAIMLLPLLVAITYREGYQTVQAFSFSSLILLAVGAFLNPLQKTKEKLYTKEGLLITGLAWIALSVFGALPFMFSGIIPGFIDALFESTAGFTTTGTSVLLDNVVLPRSILFWRSLSLFIGGLGILVLTMAVIPRLSDDGLQIMKAEVPGPTFDKVVSRTGSQAKVMYAIYFGMFLATLILLLFIGMTPFDAVMHAFGTAGTGGIAIRNGSISAYDSVSVEIIVGIGMILFGINFNLYYYLFRRRSRQVLKNEELRWYLGIILVASLFIAYMIRGIYPSEGEGILHAFFAVASIITTTGYSTVDYNTWPMATHIVLLLLMFVGGMAGSTAGGLKISRVVMMMKNAIAELRRVREPKRTITVFHEGRPLARDTLRGTLNYLIIYTLIFWVMVFLISFDVPDFLTAFSAVAATINNIGPGLGLVGPTGSYAHFNDFSKGVLIFGMLAGRLEFYPILLLFMRNTWRKF